MYGRPGTPLRYEATGRQKLLSRIKSRARKGDGAENLSILRRIARNLLKRETKSKGGIGVKRRRAG